MHSPSASVTTLVRTQRDPRSVLLSVVLPAFNEEAAISQTIHIITGWLKSQGLRWEILVVDDGSADRTSDVVRNLPRELHARAIRLSRNFGKEAALTAGIDLAQGDTPSGGA